MDDTTLQQNTFPLRTTVDELEKITRVVFKRLKRWSLGEIEISQDYYWTMYPIERYDPAKRPENLDLGSLEFDWELLQKMLKNDDVGGPYTLLELSSILRFVGDVKMTKEMPEKYTLSGESTTPIQTTVDELEKITRVVFKRLKRWNLGEIEISQDCYWTMEPIERYDPTKDPENLTLGSLEYDWEQLQEMLKNDSVVGPYTLLWLSSILRFVRDVQSSEEMPITKR